MLRAITVATPPTASAVSSPSSSSCFAVFALLFAAQRHASKSSGTTTKYQKRPSKDHDIGFKVFLDEPSAKKGTVIARQRHIYHNFQFGIREPDYHAGKNVKMDPKVYDLVTKTDGIPQLRKSKIDPEYMWVDVEADIQKVHRTRAIRKHFSASGKTSEMSHHNERYVNDELADLQEPDWRQRVMRKMPATERYPDPNLLTRGLVKSIAPKPKYFYE